MTTLLVWLHLLAAVVWIGGMLFLSLVLMPVLKQNGLAGERRLLFVALALRFRAVAWTSIFVLLLTGPLLLIGRGEDWRLELKLILVALLIALTAVHDFWLGPWAGRLVRVSSESRGLWERTLVRISPWIARLGLLLALVILLLGVALVTG